MQNFWDSIVELASTREANVETWLVLPLLEALGHDRLCIDSKVPVKFQEGRTPRSGRKPEADFVVYAERDFSRATSLIVVETKRPDELLDDGRHQGESYAQNLRAPILLMTNGRRMEIWQMHITTESRLVFDCEISALTSRRGEIEALISSDAIRAHCATIEYKCFDLRARDLGDYEHAEHCRVATTARYSVRRTLKSAGANLDTNSNNLLSSNRRGAVIIGASGFGKTTLAASLLYEGLERRWLAETTALPIEIFLPHVVLDGSPFEDFLANRIAAHKPGFTRAQLLQVAREQGLLIIADGFERVATDLRNGLEGILQLFLRDYPKTQLFVLSRVTLLAIDLPVLDLVGYNPSDLRELGRIRSITDPEARNPFSGAPDYVYRIGEVPILASLMLDRYSLEGRHTTSLASLYENWINQIFVSARPIDRARDQNLLEEIARETAHGPLSIDYALSLCRGRSDPQLTLERLVDASAISVRGTTVELQHEALADYLRAIRYWKAPSESNHPTLDSLTFDISSQFGILLVATAPDRRSRGAAWQAVACADMQLAIQSLRFAAGSEIFDRSSSDIDALGFLTDIRETIETLVSSHLGPIGASLREAIAGVPVNCLGISGMMSADDVSFSFFEAEGNPSQVRLESAHERGRRPKIYGHALRRAGYGPEAGRILGARRVQNALHDQIKERSLQGGPIWIEERVFGRLRHLSREYEFPVSHNDLQNALNVLAPHEDERVVVSGFRSGQRFMISDLIGDIRSLIQNGVFDINSWSDGFDDLDLNSATGQEAFGSIINEYYRRLQMAYAEIAEVSFPTLRRYLPTLSTMPFKFEIEAEFHNRRGYEDVTLHYRRWPVATYDEAGALVTFPGEVSDYDSNEAVQDYVARTDVLLSQFGRSFSGRSVQWGGVQIPDFEGHDTTFNGLPDESAVVRGAMKWLEKDIEVLFSEIPLYSFAPSIR